MPTLIVIDIQKGYTTPGRLFYQQPINNIAEHLRARGLTEVLEVGHLLERNV